MSELRRRLLAAFQVEQKDHLKRLRDFLELLDERGRQLQAVEYQNAMRAAHTLKGASRAVDLPGLEAVTHRLESVLSALKEGELEPGGPAVLALGQVFDLIEDYTGKPGFEDREVPPEALEHLERLLSGEPGGPGLPEPDTSELVRELPEQEESGVGDVSVRVAASALDDLSVTLGQLAAATHRHREIGQKLQELSTQLVQLQQHSGRQSEDRLLEQFQVDFRACQRTAHSLVRMQSRSQAALEGLAQELADQVRAARMLPAQDLLGDLGPIARRLGKSQNKPLEFRTKGLDIRVDRQVLEQLREPLMHMIRNAVDHGLETYDQRRGLGKPERGRLQLELRVARNRLITTLSDDGRGVDLEKVADRARALGLDFEENRESLLRLLFLPEFSTAAALGELSGRGLGLSVLQAVAERLQGRVFVSEGSPCGTVVGLDTPLSVLAQNLLLVRYRSQLFGLPSHSVERLVRVRPEELRILDGRSSCLMDDIPIPTCGLGAALGYPDSGIEAVDGRLWGVLLNITGKRSLLVVDGLVGHQECYVEPLDVPGYSNPKVTGVMRLDDESICLVLNPSRLLDTPARVEVLAAEQSKHEAPRAAPRILVVDDSITTRMLEKSILETHGYEVVVAVDGLDAIRQLRMQSVDLVISDVQMPGMDGFQLLMNLKADASFRHLPVVLLTSLEDQLDRERGLDLGAEAYLNKQRFDQSELLETVRQIV